MRQPFRHLSYTSTTGILKSKKMIRKLKTRLGIETGRIRCVGTSASLDPTKKDELAEFASEIFGEEFQRGERAVITPELEPHRLLSEGDTTDASPMQDWTSIGELVHAVRQANLLQSKEDNSELLEYWTEEIEHLNLQQFKLEGERFGPARLKCLATKPEIRSVATKLSGGTLSIHKLANQIFLKSTEIPTSAEMGTAEEALAVLISVGVLAMEDIPGTFPLRPARYHLAASGIEGILFNLSDSQTENWKSFEFRQLGNMLLTRLLIHCWYAVIAENLILIRRTECFT